MKSNENPKTSATHTQLNQHSLVEIMTNIKSDATSMEASPSKKIISVQPINTPANNGYQTNKTNRSDNNG